MTIDINEVRDAVEQEFDWYYVESEGADVVRFDYCCGARSIWIYDTGEVAGGDDTRARRVRTFIQQFHQTEQA